jgi:hypothetical protein
MEPSCSEVEVATKFDGVSTESNVWDDNRKRFWELLAEHVPPYIPEGIYS